MAWAKPSINGDGVPEARENGSKTKRRSQWEKKKNRSAKNVENLVDP